MVISRLVVLIVRSQKIQVQAHKTGAGAGAAGGGFEVMGIADRSILCQVFVDPAWPDQTRSSALSLSRLF